MYIVAVPDMHGFNSGVLLMNLQRMKDQDLARSLLLRANHILYPAWTDPYKVSRERQLDTLGNMSRRHPSATPLPACDSRSMVCELDVSWVKTDLETTKQSASPSTGTAATTPMDVTCPHFDATAAVVVVLLMAGRVY